MAAAQQECDFDSGSRAAGEPSRVAVASYRIRLAEAGHYAGAPRVSPAATGAAAGALLVGLSSLLATLAPLLF